MKQYDYQNKNLVEVDQYYQGSLQFLYETKLGRILLKVATRPFISKLYGKYQDSRFSRRKIARFIKEYHISMEDYEEGQYRSFNDFFCRKIRPVARPFSKKKEDFCSPCDAKLTVYPIDKNMSFQMKHSTYTVASLLRDYSLAEKWQGGLCMVFRLTVDDYHRYHAFDDGRVEENYRIDGVLHTVSPIAFSHVPVFLENTREVHRFTTEHFGEVIQVEVGALMVGRIINHPLETFSRGEELGYFQFGGSTVILLFPKDAVELAKELKPFIDEQTEVIVKMGQVLGKAKK